MHDKQQKQNQTGQAREFLRRLHFTLTLLPILITFTIIQLLRQVTFSESVITLRTSRRSNQKNEGSRIHVPFGALEDLGKVIVGEEKTEGGQVCWLHRTQTWSCAWRDAIRVVSGGPAHTHGRARPRRKSYISVMKNFLYLKVEWLTRIWTHHSSF